VRLARREDERGVYHDIVIGREWHDWYGWANGWSTLITRRWLGTRHEWKLIPGQWDAEWRAEAEASRGPLPGD
jgi:hypothetical protein